MNQHHKTLYAFFDCYSLPAASSLLSKFIKYADTGRLWKGRSPSEALYFSERLQELTEAVYAIVVFHEHMPEAILAENTKDACWSLTNYPLYCGWHIHATPWDFFPRHLSKKEFIDPYKALEKFTQQFSQLQCNSLIKDLLFYTLSHNSIHILKEAEGMLHIHRCFHKMIEACHLIEVRTNAERNNNNSRWAPPANQENLKP